MYNILVTGVGSIIGYGIINSLRKSTIGINIIGVDIYDDAYGKHISDQFIQGVRADSVNYIDFINEIVNLHKIDLIIPGIEQDLYKLWENKNNINTSVVINNDLCIRLSKNKWDTFNFLSGYTINLIPTLYQGSFTDSADVLGLPFLIKPVSSYASKGIEVINNEAEFNAYVQKYTNERVCQKIVGSMESEFTISIFGDGAGKILDYIILRRNLSGEGATKKAIFVEDNDILVYVEQLAGILKPVGPLNIQVRKEAGKVYLLEINPRLSSACSIRTLMGYNEPELCIRYFLLKESIKPAAKIQGTVIRYIADYMYQS